MFKKNLWIVGLLAALAIMFAGCIDPIAEDNSGVQTDVWKLSEFIKDLPVGPVDYDSTFGTVSPIAKCGNPNFTIIQEGGVKKLKIDGMTQTWGEGIDIRNDTDKSNIGLGFKAGDKLYVKGSADPVGIMFNPKGETFGKMDNWSSEEIEFEKTFTISSDDATSIRGNGKGIRIHYDDGKGDGRKGVIIFEEIYLSGKRNADDLPKPPTDYTVPGNGSYVPPKSEGYDVYIDLNTARFGYALDEDKFPVGSITAPAGDPDKTGKMEIKWTYDGQTVFVPFTDTVKELIVNAALAGYTFDVTINGTQTGWLKWCMGVDAEKDWQMTTVVDGSSANTFGSVKNLQFNSTKRLATELAGFVFLCEPTADKAALTAGANSMVINSIKVTLKPSGLALTALGGTNAFDLNKPGTGHKADTTIEGTNFTGVVTWYPALPASGKFEALKQYRAEITILPAPGFTVDSSTDFVITPSVEGVFNYTTRVYSTVYYPYTAAIPELELGTIFDLKEWFKDNDKMGDPLVSGGSPTLTFDKTNKKIIFGGISKPENTWEGIDIDLSKIGAGADPALWKIKIVVKGKLLTFASGETSAKMLLQGQNYPPSTWVANTDVTSAGGDFTLTVNELQSDFLTLGNGNVRITSQDGNAATYEITDITIENLGGR